MSIFTSVLNQMLFLFLCILIGFYLRKTNKLPESASSIISKLENLVCIPAMIVNNFSVNCSLENLLGNVDLLVYGFIFIAIQVILAFVVAPFFTKEKSEKGIYLYSLAVVNFGFMGNSLVAGLYGSEALFRYLIFTIPTCMVVYSFGIVWLTAGKEKFKLKMLFNPMFLYMALGMLIGIFQIPLPSFISKTISGFGACYSPLAMLITGLVIGGYDIKKLLGNKKIYVLTAYRCVILPIILFILANLAGVSPEIMKLAAFIIAMPLGLNTIVFPAAYGYDTNLGASMAVISNVAGLITVPLLLSYFI